MTLQIWRHGSVRCQEAEERGRREPQAEEAAGRADARHFDAARDARKKLLTPGAKRFVVEWAVKTTGISQRRSFALVGIDPRVYRCRSRKPDDEVVGTRGLRSLIEEALPDLQKNSD